MRSPRYACLVALCPAFALAQVSSSISTITPPEQPLYREIGRQSPLFLPEPGQPQSVSGAESRAELFDMVQATESVTATGVNFSDKITFDEFALGSVITDNYRDRGLVFGGSELTIVDDIASASSPVLGGTAPGGDLFEGDITGTFVIPGTSIPATVYRMNWKIGAFDELNSVEMSFFGPRGDLLFSLINSQPGFVSYSARGGSVGIASWRFHIISSEPAGYGIDNLYFSIPGQDDIDREKGEVGCAVGNPINPAVGNKYQTETDYRGVRQFPLTVSRAYNSIDGAWQIFPEVRFTPGDEAVQLVRADGKGLTYFPFGASTWRATGTEITGELKSFFDSMGVRTGWRYTTLDDQVEVYDAQGRITSVTQRSGIGHSYTYTPENITVTHSFGGSVTYSLGANGTITGFTDPAGNSYIYGYNAINLVTSVRYPNGGGSRIYHYEDLANADLLTGISDGNGDRFATWVYDTERRAVSSEHNGGAERETLDYTYVDDPDFPQTRVTNALGKATTYQYITVNGARKVFRVTGHASANCVGSNQSYGFDANAFIASRTDWEGNVTAYIRNSRGQELSRTEAVGSPQERAMSTVWHPTFNVPLKITEPGRETSYTYDADGNELSRSVVDTTTP